MSENAAKTLKDLQTAWRTIAQEHFEMAVIQCCQFNGNSYDAMPHDVVHSLPSSPSLCSAGESNLISISTSAGVSFSPLHSAHRC